MKYLPWINTSLLVALLVAVLAFATDRPQQAYVNLADVFEGFELQQDLSAQLEQLNNTRQLQLDSMELKLNQLAAAPDFDAEAPSAAFMALRSQYLRTEKRYAEDTERLTNEYDQQIWTQLNQYLADFGQQENYSFVFGANGQGHLMFADPELNRTSEVIAYINNRFHGS